jgi:hypothetical protein
MPRQLRPEPSVFAGSISKKPEEGIPMGIIEKTPSVDLGKDGQWQYAQAVSNISEEELNNTATKLYGTRLAVADYSLPCDGQQLGCHMDITQGRAPRI